MAQPAHHKRSNGRNGGPARARTPRGDARATARQSVHGLVVDSLRDALVHLDPQSPLPERPAGRPAGPPPAPAAPASAARATSRRPAAVAARSATAERPVDRAGAERDTTELQGRPWARLLPTGGRGGDGSDPVAPSAGPAEPPGAEAGAKDQTGEDLIVTIRLSTLLALHRRGPAGELARAEIVGRLGEELADRDAEVRALRHAQPFAGRARVDLAARGLVAVLLVVVAVLLLRGL